MNPVKKFAKRVKGQLCVGVTFHPKVIQGPTIHNLLEDMVQSPSLQDIKPLATSSVLVSSPRKRIPKGKISDLTHELGQRKVKARLAFKLRSLHLCGFSCSCLRGHVASHTPDVAPIVRITFGDFVHELHVDPRDCKSINFCQEWPVYSSFSGIAVEVFKPTTVSGVCQNLIDGSSVVKISSAIISCLGIPVLDASDWTLDPPRPAAGPGGHPPEKGYRWMSLYSKGEVCGLIEISTDYTEHYSVILNSTGDPDVTYVPPDEREFDPSIIQRNIERLDELVFHLKSMQLWYAETLDWKYPVRTVAVWSSLTFVALHTPANRLPLCMMLAVVAVLCFTFLRFRRGCVHRGWIEEKPGSTRRGPFRPTATLRFVPVCAKGLGPLSSTPSQKPDTFVRIYYEPNYKNISVQLIAQTECARQSVSPVWALPQLESKSSEAFREMNNKLMRDKIRNLSRYEQDTLMQDVVEPWPRPDGHIDSHAFRYRLLQPAQINARTGAEELVPWSQCSGVIRYDIMQDNGSNQWVRIGRGRVALKSLLSDERSGGPQTEQVIELPLSAPPQNSSRSLGGVDPLDTNPSTIVVRMQLVLRDPHAAITATESVESEALYDITEMSHEKELSLVGKYHKARDFAKNIQQTLGQLCSMVERLKNLVLWVHPVKTLFLLMLALAVCFWLLLIPANYLIVLSLASLVSSFCSLIACGVSFTSI